MNATDKYQGDKFAKQAPHHARDFAGGWGGMEPPAPPFPDPATKTREFGTRLCVVVCCALDTPNIIAVERFEVRLNETFGGFTRTEATGGWRNPDTGASMVEPVLRYEVSCPAQGLERDDQTIETIATWARDLGRALSQEWVHVTSHYERAHHVKCS